MRLTCPLCGPRDRREFYYYGAEDYLARPAPDAEPQAWNNYLHLRDNPAGITKDLWYHDMGCSSWLLVTRNTVTHEIHDVQAVAAPKAAPTGAAPAGAAPETVVAKPKAKSAAKAAPKPGQNTDQNNGSKGGAA